MKDFIVNAKNISLPSGWDEITVDQFFRLKDNASNPDILTQLAILSNTERGFWFDTEIPDKEFELIVDAITWAVTPPDLDSFIMPPVYLLGEKTLVIPKDLTLKTLGQKVTFEQMVLTKALLIDDKPVFDINVVCEAVAIYLQPLYTGEKFDPEKLEHITHLVRLTLFSDVYGIASFFLTQLFPSVKPKANNSNVSTTGKKKRPVLKSSTSLA